MATGNGILAAIADLLIRALGSRRRTPTRTTSTRGASTTSTRPRARLRTAPEQSASAPVQTEPGRTTGTETVRIDADRVRDLRIGYEPDRDGAPDAGEIVWTWVPYEENDGRGKDRPVLVIGRQSVDRVYVVRLTSKPHDGDRDFLSIGTGAWDSQGRESWVDIELLYSVHEHGLRREAAVLDRQRYARVATALASRYGWTSAV
ncbi:type II toxin-antitoxin system PemK/MazF family toxin [Microbacterium sp. ZW T5_45]|uniref:type II toxin-antitoxin system PemK/MazF family toxin n=1 Tax=Microbacterium sp. ZW T5_45 TaxID=3378080 RepID=UPI003852C424